MLYVPIVQVAGFFLAVGNYELPVGTILHRLRFVDYPPLSLPALGLVGPSAKSLTLWLLGFVALAGLLQTSRGVPQAAG